MPGPARGSTTAQGRTRRDQVLAAALRAFGERGFRGTSMASIADEVGLTEPGLLHHFPSKQRLLLAVLEHYHAQQASRAVAIESERSFEEAILDLAEQHDKDPTFIRFFLVLAAESTNAEHPAHYWFVGRYDRLRAAWAKRIASEQQAGRMRDDIPAQQLAVLLVAVFDGVEIQYLYDPRRFDMRSRLQAFLTLSRATA